MRLVIDLQGAQTPQSGERGVGRYTRGLTEALLQEAGSHEIILALNGAFPDSVVDARHRFGGLVPTTSIRAWRSPIDVSFSNEGWYSSAMEAVREGFLASLKPDAVLVSSMVEGLHDARIATSIGVYGQAPPTGSVLYDVTPMEMSDVYLTDPPTRSWYQRKIEYLRRAQRWFAISESSRNDAIEHLDLPPDNVVLAVPGVEDRFKALGLSAHQRRAVAARHGIVRPFVFYLGGFDPHKNVGRMIEAFSRLPASIRDDLQLVLAGDLPAPILGQLTVAIVAAGLASNDVLFLGRVSDGAIVQLLNSCELFVYPSLREGFGLPVLEAMASGAPVICGNRSSLPEVVGLEEATFDPSNAESMAHRMRLVLSDAAFRSGLIRHSLERAKRFSWRSTARRVIAGYETLQSENKKRERALVAVPNPIRARRRMAWITHWPLSEQRLRDLRALDAFYYIDVFVDAVSARENPFLFGLSVRAIETLRAVSPRYDRIVVELADTEGITGQIAGLALKLEGRLVSRALDGGQRNFATGNHPYADDGCEHPKGTSYLYTAIEDAYTDIGSAIALVDFLAQQVPKEAGASFDWVIAETLAANEHPPSRKRLLVDVTGQAMGHPGSGISRVVHRLAEWLASLLPAGAVELVRLHPETGRFHYARRFGSALFGRTEENVEEMVELAVGDHFLALDLNHSIRGQVQFFERLRELGGRSYAVVYDLLPFHRPDWFPPGLSDEHRRWFEFVAKFDRLICISRSVANEVERELGTASPSAHVGWFHLGSDLPSRVEREPVPQLSTRPSIMIVSIIWARKGHAQALKAFELLWDKGVDVNFVLAGRVGWGMDSFVAELRKHPEFNHRLFWFEGPDDELLNRLYATVDGILVASEGEGFGLPVVEALNHRKPVLARDLAVFHEIAGDAIRYFSGLDATALALALNELIDDLASGQARVPNEPKPLSWGQSAQQLLKTMKIDITTFATSVSDEGWALVALT